MKARALAHVDTNKAEVMDVEVREPGAGEVMIETHCTSISPGTELRCLAGKEAGGSGFPYVAGYALAGRVLKTGKHTALSEGAKVFACGTQDASIPTQWGGHISHALVSESDVHAIPEHVSLQEASLTKLGSIAFHGYRLARPLAGETVAVIGLGVLGQISARLFAMSGAKTVCCDLSPFRVEKAKAAGVEAYVVDGTVQETLGHALGEGADIVVDVTGAPPVLPQAVKLARDLAWDNTPLPGARFVVQGSYPGAIEVPYKEVFMKELQLLFPRDSQPRDRSAVIGLLASDKLSLADCITGTRPPEDIQNAYEELMDRKAPVLTSAIEWKKEA